MNEIRLSFKNIALSFCHKIKIREKIERRGKNYRKTKNDKIDIKLVLSFVYRGFGIICKDYI